MSNVDATMMRLVQLDREHWASITFRTHKGERPSPKDLRHACFLVSHDLRTLAHAIRHENAYAAHVTEAEKDATLAKALAFASEVQDGKHLDGFTIWQRVNTKLTGECVAFLPSA